ncbi:MAG: RagB/SusD family nutrient uptake outer membrane protein [Cyclobacteriaceae bacterium]|nr:RagB/SusD family nutrient uptake outer membrane protein [Cyclobacteriaceae bacterium]
MKKYIAIIFILGILSSCQDFLTEKPYDFLGNNFYKTEKDAAIGLNAVFVPMQAQTYYQRTAWLVSELPGDYLQTALVNAPRQEIEGFFYTDANDEIRNWWINSYIMINRANDLLEQVPSIVMNDASKNNILGNARFLRALAYFDLIRSFGDVPLVLKTIKSPSDPNLKPARTAFADVYTQIIEDLTFAEANCVKENAIVTGEKGRVSSGAAAALLAKVYLTRASTSAAVSGDNQKALDACNRVIAQNLYKLIPVYGDIFDPDPAKENKDEHIFSVQFDNPNATGNIVIAMMFPTVAGVIGGQGSGSFKLNNAFVASFGGTDIRKAWNTSNMAGATVLPYYYLNKYRDPNRTANGNNNARNNFIILRMADVQLMHSEATNAINTGDVNKFNGINLVRARAGLGPLSFGTTPTNDNFIDALLQERAWELCMEGHRRYDLIRMGRLKQYQKTVYNRDIDDNHLLFPVPQSEILINPNLKPNNPGF